MKDFKKMQIELLSTTHNTSNPLPPTIHPAAISIWKGAQPKLCIRRGPNIIRLIVVTHSSSSSHLQHRHPLPTHTLPVLNLPPKLRLHNYYHDDDDDDIILLWFCRRLCFTFRSCSFWVFAGVVVAISLFAIINIVYYLTYLTAPVLATWSIRYH